MRSERLLTAFTSNLSLFGCYAITGIPIPEGTKVSLRITRGGTTFAAFGKVVYSKPKYGMGVEFRPRRQCHFTPLIMVSLDKSRS